MAKIASSKPYAMSTKKQEEKEMINPVRTSPRRKSKSSFSNEEEQGEKDVVEKGVAASDVVKNSRKFPVAPRFNESKKKTWTPKKVKLTKTDSPKTLNVRRKSDVNLQEEAMTTNENLRETEKEKDTEREEIEMMEGNGNFEKFEDEYDYVQSIQSSSIYHEEFIVANENENSPIYDDDEEISSEGGESAEEFHYDKEEEKEKGISGNESETDDNSEYLNEEKYNDQFKYTSESVKSRLAQYFNRQEGLIAVTGNSSKVGSASTTRSQMWNRMKDWIGANLIGGAKEFGEMTMEYTKKAIEEISRRLVEPKKQEEKHEEVDVFDGPQIYMNEESEHERDEEKEIIPEVFEEEIYQQNYDDFTRNHEDNTRNHEDYTQNHEYQTGNNEDHNEVFHDPIQSRQSSFHDMPVENDVTVILPVEMETIETNPNHNNFTSEVMNSRLTELVLFFAKCTSNTPLPAIYEHLEEFFTLKGQNTLNYTEKQLISGLIKEFLTVKDVGEVIEEEKFVPVYPLSNSNNNSNNNYNYNYSSQAESPKRLKVLLNSGIRFRAPKFTAEEENRLEEMEQARQIQKNISSSSNYTSRLSTPLQRSKLQNKLLAPEVTRSDIEKMPASSGRISNGKRKDDSVNSAIEDIISQKIMEAKRKEESDRIETDKLKIRVAELERENRERTTKEALLQQQIDEQKKELEIEKQAAKEKIESIKLANLSKPPHDKMKQSSFVCSEESPSPVIFSEKAKGFNFEKEKAPTHEISSSSPVFKSFEFGSNKLIEKGPDVDESKSTGFGFSFGSRPSAAVTDADKPLESKSNDKSTSVGFGFGSSGGFSFGVKTEDESAKQSELNKQTAAAGAFTFGPPTEEPFSSKSEERGNASSTRSAFNFGAKLSEQVPKPAFNFGVKKTEETGSKSNSVNATSFGFSDSNGAKSSAFNFGSQPTTTTPFTSTGFNFAPLNNDNVASSSAASPLITNSFNFTKVENNPFSALNSGANVFGNAAHVNFNSSSTGFPTNDNNSNNSNFSFPSLNVSNAPGGIIPMNFNSSSNNTMGGSSEGFQMGNRPISIPKRRTARK